MSDKPFFMEGVESVPSITSNDTEGYREVNHQWQDAFGNPLPRQATVEEMRRAFAAGRIAGLREAAAWHVLKAAHYERQVHDTFGKGELHTDAARAILALAEGGEG
jgi:hypothetical protein